MHSKQKLQLIIALMKFHIEAKNMALVKLHKALKKKTMTHWSNSFSGSH